MRNAYTEQLERRHVKPAAVGRSVRGGHRELESSPPPIASTRYSPCTERPSKERGAVGKGGPSKRRTDGRTSCRLSPARLLRRCRRAKQQQRRRQRRQRPEGGGGRGRQAEASNGQQRGKPRRRRWSGGAASGRARRTTDPSRGRERGKREKKERTERGGGGGGSKARLPSFLLSGGGLPPLFPPPLPPLLHSALLLSSHPHSSSSIPSIQPFLLSYRTWTSQTWSPASPRTAAGAATAEEWGERAGDSSGSNKHFFVPDLSLSTQSVRVTRVGGVRRLWLPASWPPRPERVVAATKTKRVGVAPPEGWRRKGRTEDFFVHRGKERKGWRRLRWRKRKWWLHPSPYRRESLSN